MLQCKNDASAPVRPAERRLPWRIIAGHRRCRCDRPRTRLCLDEQDLLRQLMAGPASGDALARRHGVTRAAVWKRMQALREAGVAIEAEAGRGYALAQPLDLLDAGAIVAALAAGPAGMLSCLEVAWSLDSTNSELLRREAPRQGVSALLAERQTAGRGRRGRRWASPLAANLYLSLSRRYAGGLARLGGLSLAAGVATVEALHSIGAIDAQLKWPNDLVVGPRKLGGLLVEGSGEPAGTASAVLGLGLNVRMPSAQAAAIDQPWIDLQALLPAPPPRNALAARLLDHLLPALALFDREGLAPFLPRYQRHDVLHGRAVELAHGDSLHRGIALGVAEDGALRIAIGGGERRFHSGEVSVRAA